MSATHELLADAEERGQPEQEQEQDMQGDCPQDVLWDFAALVAPKIEAKVVTRKSPQLSGNSVDGGHARAEIIEWVLPGGEVVARKVTACNQTERWLRADLATDTLIARSDQVAEKERILKEMANYCRASQQHNRDQMAQTYVLSSSLIHAAARRNATLGRLYDSNSRGDQVRGNLVAALDRAIKAEGGAK